MKEAMKAISESTPLALGFVLTLLGGVWAFAWSARGMKESAEAATTTIQEVSTQLVETTTQLRVEFQMEMGKRLLRQELESWITQVRLMNPTLQVPAVPKFD